MKLKKEFTINEICGMYVAVDVDNQSDNYNSVIQLNETGKRIFELIQEEMDEDGIVSVLREEYEAPDDILHSEVRKIIKRLEDEDLLA